MKAFVTVSSRVLPLDRANVDTDAIIPKQYLKSIRRTGFGQYLFDDWRYLDSGDLDVPVAGRRPNPDFVLNQPQYAGAQILLARENFGCGSSREHAVWALDDYGLRAVIAPSFADIFYSNSFKNGFLPVALDAEAVDRLFARVSADPALRLTIDLPAQTVTSSAGDCYSFALDAHRKHCLINGLDDIGLTLQHADAIADYERQLASTRPWLLG